MRSRIFDILGMRKFMTCLLILFLCLGCSQKKKKFERIIEDGVEVVVNHTEPYQIKGQPTTIELEKEFSIDTEKDSTAELGLVDIGKYFDVDSEGNVYVVSPMGKGNTLFKFSKKGNFITSFGHRGQGPGELVSRRFPPLFLFIHKEEQIAVTNYYRRKLVYFNQEGDFIREEKLDSKLMLLAVIPLPDGNYLAYENRGSPSYELPLSLFSHDFKKIKELGFRKIPDIGEEKIKGIYYMFSWAVSGDKIFTGKQEQGYVINVFNLKGQLLRKIKKEYKPVPLTNEYKEKYLKIYKNREEFRDKIYFPKNLPPFHSFFTDQNARLFVMTYEEGDNPGEYMYDIFNENGLFIGRKSLRIHHNSDSLFARMKNNRLYCIHEKESGYKEFTAYKLTWKKTKPRN
jgi:hypothetical protein